MPKMNFTRNFGCGSRKACPLRVNGGFRGCVVGALLNIELF